MSATAEVDLDPTVVELFAIRNFTKSGIGPLDRTAAREAEWRALPPDTREKNREAAATLLQQLLADGLVIRPTKASTDALHRAITNPATLAYELPVRPKGDAMKGA